MESKKKIDRETAEAEITRWLDKKKVYQETRDKYKDHIDVLVEAIMNGDLSLDEEFCFEHQLLFPLETEAGNVTHDKLKYRCRINDKIVQPHMKNVKSDDADNRLNALIAAITNTSKGVISFLDSADKRIATAIGIFFM